MMVNTLHYEFAMLSAHLSVVFLSTTCATYIKKLTHTPLFTPRIAENYEGLHSTDSANN